MNKLAILFAGSLLMACSSNNQTTDAYGNLEATEIFVSSEVAGKILNSSKKEGDQVEKNESLALIDTIQIYLKKGQVLATISALKDKLQNVPVQLDVYQQRQQVLQHEVNRIKNLLAEGAATQKQLDDLTGELNIVNKQSHALESQLTTANRGILAEIRPLNWQLMQLNDQISRSTIKSPISGTILQQFKEQGELVMPGQPLVKVANLDEMEAKIFITEDQLSSIKIGGRATIYIDSTDGNQSEFEGTISWISDKAEFTPKSIQTKSERANLVYAVKLKAKNDGSLKIGMPVDVTFIK